MGGRGSSGSHSGARVFGHDPMFRDFRTFATQSEAIRYHLANNFDLAAWNAMSAFERNGVYQYTFHWYGLINSALRDGRPADSQVQGFIDGATAGLEKWRAAENVITFRGANLHWTANLLGGTENQMENPAFLRSRIGKTVTDKGFMSSGTHKDSAWSAAVQYKIYVNKGASGMYVDQISANRGEYEFLFNRNTQFKVHEIKTNSAGRIVEMVLEALPYKKK